MEVSQYQTVTVNLDPTVGSEIKKTRPCVVISPDEMNRHLRTVVIAPMTSTRHNYPTRAKVMIEGRVSRIALDQICTIDKIRIIKTGNQISEKEIVELKSIIKRTYVE
jgi:mRNA interferase MazF